MQPPQVLDSTQSQSREVHDQLVQEPALGPLWVPARQEFDEAHQPQPGRDEHVSQLVALEHVSAGPASRGVVVVHALDV